MRPIVEKITCFVGVLRLDYELHLHANLARVSQRTPAREEVANVATGAIEAIFAFSLPIRGIGDRVQREHSGERHLRIELGEQTIHPRRGEQDGVRVKAHVACAAA